MTRVTDPRGTPTDFEVNALNQTVAKQTQGATFGERARAEFHYDAVNNLVRVDVENRDGEGTLNPTNAWFTTQYEYDPLHRLTRLMEEEGIYYSVLTNEYVYDGNDRLVLERSPQAVQGGDPFHVTQAAYDERGLPFREIRAPGSPLQSTTQYDYDANGNPRRVNKIDVIVWKAKVFEHDGFDRCTRVTDPMGNETRYDANGNRTRATRYGETTDVPGSAGNRRLAETRYEYDALDRLVRFRPAFFDIFTELPIGDGFQDNTIAYAPNGLVVATTNDRGHGTVFTFDTTMFLTAIEDVKSNRVDYTYDANGNLLSETETGRSDLGGPDAVFVRQYQYDALDRRVTAADNVGNTNRYLYDSRGNRIRHIDPLGFWLEGDFDSISRPTSNRKGVGGSAQNSSRTVWDAASRLVASTDGNTNTTEYAYDSLDRVIRTTLADGTSVTNVYDVHGNLIWTRDASGTEIVCVYDALDRCIQKSIAPGPGVAADTTVETYQYDGLSRLVGAQNNQTDVVREYDSLGRCVREGTASPTLGFNPREYTRTFDAHGLALAQTYPSGRLVEYSYDALDRPISLGWRAGAGQPYADGGELVYIGPCDVARITRSNGIQTDYTRGGRSGVPNPAGDFGWGQIQRVRHAAGGGAGPVVDERSFAHDRNQNKTLRALTEPFTPRGPTNRQDFVYDSLDRLMASVQTTPPQMARVTEYVLDPMGNRLSVILDGVTNAYRLDPVLPVPGDFQVDQYTETPLDARQYDENGNLDQTVAAGAVGPVTTAFIYDYADRLVAVQNDDGPVAAYAYDALGRRIAKVLYAGRPAVPVLTNRYLYADGQVIEEEDGGGAVQRTYVLPHVFDQKGRIANTPYTFDTSLYMEYKGVANTFDTSLFANYVGLTITGGGEVLYPHCDDQGSLLALTDAEGHVVERFDYDDYGAPSFLDANGNPRPGASSSLTGVPQLFHGLEWDGETGLYWNGGYLDPNTGSTLCRTYAFPHVFDQKGRAYADNNPHTLKKEEGGRHTPFHNRMLGGALPGGAVISAAVSSVSTLGGGGGGAASASYAISGGINGGMPNRISMNVTVPKQTQGSTFGEKVNAGLHAAGGALAQGASRAKGTVKFFNDAKGFGFLKEEGGRHTPFHNKYNAFRTTDVTGEIVLMDGRSLAILKTKHDTAKNSIGNIR